MRYLSLLLLFILPIAYCSSPAYAYHPHQEDVVTFRCKAGGVVYPTHQINSEGTPIGPILTVIEVGHDCASAFSVLYSMGFRKVSNNPSVFRRLSIGSFVGDDG